MTAAVVVDTNVILVANAGHADASPECVIECVNRLQELMRNGAIAIDDAYRIVNEYQNKTSPKAGKGAGDVFLKWVLTHMANPTRVQQITLAEFSEDRFTQFPVPALEAQFDRADRKFAAVANAHPDKPPIWQAVDCKWLDWWPQLQTVGVQVKFLCGDDVCRFYKRKFPRKHVPALP